MYSPKNDLSKLKITSSSVYLELVIFNRLNYDYI